ncbi:rod shape-determining protein RodA [Roseospirillum parvum]|uniref:Peptidoglycan glycosyltransferase MrdB n=1 Tax=Roseospirillum parvum TaxID=83401 RepID=A0A1G7V4H7_9PROT|nr:rod shape-determining protein RodA [Roseospirillum parvum]SDG54279.1 rod shape determining protein RodA [Roseospirillum parvum]
MSEREFLRPRWRRGDMTIAEKLWQISWSYVLIIAVIAGIGVIMLYSAGNGSFDPWASRHAIRFAVGLGVMLTVALIDIRLILRYAYLLYAATLVLLVGVELMGHVGMGAQRWIDLGFFHLQPSEVMKIVLVLALARFFHGTDIEQVGRPTVLLVPLLMVAAPAVLVLRQPDLGTALMMVMGAGVIFFLAGVRLWKFGVVLAAALAALPLAWSLLLHDYQKNRVRTFLDPERDPLGAGYHIIQSKIALGSGGIWGKGFLAGTQSHLEFLPERQTDFIFTMLAEERGMIGGLVLLALYALVMVYGYLFALRSQHQFGRLVVLGVSTTFFLYVFINVAMVMGLIPVVGVPLPLISYGGTVMLSLMVGFGLILSVWVHRDVEMGRHG